MDGNRGTLYNRDHTDKNISEEKYWDFDVTNMALEDQTAQIEYILAATQSDSISYVGYSMGTMQMFYALGMGTEDQALQGVLNKIDKVV